LNFQATLFVRELRQALSGQLLLPARMAG